MMMIMKNTKSSGSKHANVRKEKNQQQENSPRSPLKVKDLNVSSSCSSSSTVTTSTSTSSEAPRGCLSFFLSNHHSSSIVSKNACHQPKSVVTKTPKSAPNVKNSRVKKCNYPQIPEKPTSRIVHKLRKNPPFSSRSNLCDELSSGSELKLSENAGNYTPVTKLGNGLGSDNLIRHDGTLKLEDNNTNCSDLSSPVPPVQASVSPEIQGGSASVVPATPTTCYGAGHVLSGISDRRKCKPKGILTIGNNDLFGSSKAKMFDNGDENVTMVVNNRKASLVPSPTDASVHWLLSPCDENKIEGHEDEDGSGLRLNRFESIGCLSSSSSSLGFSSELLNKSGSAMTTSDSTIATRSSTKSRSQGLFGPSFDHFVCSPTPSSPVSMPSWKLEASPEQNNHLNDQARGATPYSDDSMGNGNVIRTPQLNSSSPNFGLSYMSRDEISRLWFDYELDSVAEVLRRVSLSPECQVLTAASPKTSFEFNPLIEPASSIDFSLFRKAIDSQIYTEIPDSLLPESEVRISWREGLASYIFEMDELDCCRCLSDEEDNAIGCSDDISVSNRIAANKYDSIDRKGEGSFTSNRLDPSQESPSDDGGGSLPVSENSSWENLFSLSDGC